MCLKCSKKRMQQLLKIESRQKPKSQKNLFICCIDHINHVHIRFNRIGHESEDEDAWQQLPCTFEQLQTLLPEETRIHVHEEQTNTATPASDAVLHKLELSVKPLADCSAIHLGEEAVVCSICQDRIDPSTPVLPLTCGHAFHHSCLTQWLNHANTCPTCRYELSDSNVLGIDGEMGSLIDAAFSEHEDVAAHSPGVELSINSPSRPSRPRRTFSLSPRRMRRTQRAISPASASVIPAAAPPTTASASLIPAALSPRRTRRTQRISPASASVIPAAAPAVAAM